MLRHSLTLILVGAFLLSACQTVAAPLAAPAVVAPIAAPAVAPAVALVALADTLGGGSNPLNDCQVAKGLFQQILASKIGHQGDTGYYLTNDQIYQSPPLGLGKTSWGTPSEISWRDAVKFIGKCADYVIQNLSNGIKMIPPAP
jgi:hypothetical protein